MMDDYLSCEEDYNYGDADDDYDYDDYDDRDSLDEFRGIENEIHRPVESPSAKVITKESLLAAQREDLRRVMDFLSLREHHARTLLIHFRWDVEKVFDVLVEKDKDQLYTEAGVTDVQQNNLALSQQLPEVICDICIEKVSRDVVTTMDCGHYFCNNCWTEHFIVKINEGQSRRIRCMAYKCNASCDEAKIRNLVSARDTDLSEKFERFLLESYIEDNKRVKWCPRVPHCGNAIRVEDDEFCEVECACGLQFCFSCSNEAHSPCSCLMWKLWAKKCQDDSETMNWMTVNTKPCPKCLKPVEKNGGCNLVCCICGQAFCWLCGGATGMRHTWTSIDGHSCGRYHEHFEKNAELAKKELWRYMHYHTRYKAHTDSFKLESKLNETVQGKISKLEERNLAVKDCSWVTKGLYRLFRSRRILSYSYAFAYYMFGHLFKDQMTEEEKVIKQNLFEDHQQQLEANVEKLSLFFEEPFDQHPDDGVMETRFKIITLLVTVDDLCKKLYDCIENDLLYPLQQTRHIIAPYKSKGVEKASELSVGWDGILKLDVDNKSGVVRMDTNSLLS